MNSTRRQLLAALPALALSRLSRPAAGTSSVVADFDAAHAIVTEAARRIDAPHPVGIDEALEQAYYAARDRLLDVGDRLVKTVRADQPDAMMLVTKTAAYVFDEQHDTFRCEVQRVALSQIARV
jgi:hypothetical protein